MTNLAISDHVLRFEGRVSTTSADVKENDPKCPEKASNLALPEGLLVIEPNFQNTVMVIVLFVLISCPLEDLVPVV